MKKFLFAILIVVLMAGTAVGSVLIYHYTEGSKNEITILKNEKGTISASERKAKNGKEVELFCVAKDLYLGTRQVTISDITNKHLVDSKLYEILCNGMAIRRFGKNAWCWRALDEESS